MGVSKIKSNNDVVVTTLIAKTGNSVSINIPMGASRWGAELRLRNYATGNIGDPFLAVSLFYPGGSNNAVEVSENYGSRPSTVNSATYDSSTGKCNLNISTGPNNNWGYAVAFSL